MALYTYLPKYCIRVCQNVAFLFTENIALLFTGYTFSSVVQSIKVIVIFLPFFL